MHLKPYQILLFILVASCWGSPFSAAQDETEQKKLEVSMRMIGHRVLLNFGDSTSRVLPIKNESGRYIIEFDTDFQFDSGILVATVDSVAQETQMANGYLVEVKKCDTQETVYSYIVGQNKDEDLIPCKTRPQPPTCYKLYITILEQNIPDTVPEKPEAGSSEAKGTNYLNSILLVALPVLVFFFIFQYKKKRRSSASNGHIISLGKFQFDRRNMHLTYENTPVELTSKEADLLFLLYSSANTTLEREHILKVVWGDEGDYIGRTLDVFVSKLRKKLEADPNVKIVNIRGVGYKLVLN